MNKKKIAILGCGTVGGGVSRILLDMKDRMNHRAGFDIELKKIVELFPKNASKRFNLPINFFYGKGEDLTKKKASDYIQEIIRADDIDLVVETIGGSNDSILNIVLDILRSKKHLVTANKALLAEHGKIIFETARDNNVIIGYEAAVCGAIPIIKTIRESFSGDEVVSISGIMNGTSNYILSKMQNEGMIFKEALKLAQQNGYAELDPTLDINGVDAGHKLVILIKLAFGIDVEFNQLPIKGIENIKKEDLNFANEMDSTIKLVSFAEKKDDKIYASVGPMMVKNSNFLSQVNGATNAVRVINKYSGKHILLGTGAGSLETASSIVSDIIFICKYFTNMSNSEMYSNCDFIDAKHFIFPYNITFETEDIPGITGFVTTAIGNQNINIDTVGHNKHNRKKAVFSLSTMPCTLNQINNAIGEIKTKRPDILLSEPKIIPVLY